MKTSMLGERQRRVLVSRWSEVLARGIADVSGVLLSPGDLVRLPAYVRRGADLNADVPATVMGYALGRDGSPSVVVDAPAWNGTRMDSWRTWIVNGNSLSKIEVRDVPELVKAGERIGLVEDAKSLVIDAAARSTISSKWLEMALGGVHTKAGIAIQPGDLVRLPRNVARNRGSQLHAAGLCLGFAVGSDGSPCVVIDAVGEDVPDLIRWRTWLARGSEVVVIDTKEAWRLESLYSRDGRFNHKG